MVRGRGGGRVDRMMPGQAQAAAAGMLPVAGDPDGSLIAADELPDGLVIADHAGCVIVFNRAAGRITGITPSHALGQDVRHALPLQDADGRSWWAHARPYHGLSTRTRHPERSLYLPCGTELLVTVAYELRSQLTSVKGFTATLLAKWPRFTDDQKLVMLETVNADADRVTRLITELLDVSRIEAGRIEVHRELVDVPERVRRFIAGRVAAGEPEDRYRLEVISDLPDTW